MLGLNRGYTLLELMVTLAIVGIVATLAVPSFNSVIEKQRVKSAADTLWTSLVLARSEAITRNQNVTVQQSGTAWSEGWTLATSAATLRKEKGITGSAIVEQSSPAISSFFFYPNGRASASVRFQVSSGTYQRCVLISLIGKPRNSEGSCS